MAASVVEAWAHSVHGVLRERRSQAPKPATGRGEGALPRSPTFGTRACRTEGPHHDIETNAFFSGLEASHHVASQALVEPGFLHTCALKGDGSVWCWGHNVEGELGVGTTTDSSTPRVVGGLDMVSLLATGGGHTCAVRIDGTVACWGYNGGGELGAVTTETCMAGAEARRCSTTPVSTSGIAGVIAIAAGQVHTCVLKSDGVVACWGENIYGQLGDGTTTQRSTPVSVTGL